MEQYRNVPAVTTAEARRAVPPYLTNRREGSFGERYLLPPFASRGYQQLSRLGEWMYW
jgi:hypothetical protein